MTPRPFAKWTAAEDAILAQFYPDHGTEAATLQALPNRSADAIAKRAQQRHIHWQNPPRHNLKWANGRQVELQRLVDAKLSPRAIGERMGESRNAIIGALWRLGIPVQDSRKTYVPSDIYNTLPDIDVSGCCWLDGEPRELRYCGKPVARKADSGHGESYCAEHRAIVWGAVPQGRKPDLPGRAKW